LRTRRIVGGVVAIGCALLVGVGPPAAASAQTAPVLRVAVISDINSSYGTIGYSPEVTNAIRRIVELEPDLVIGVGDLIAGQRSSPRLERHDLEAMWEAFLAQVLDPLRTAGIPFLPVPGNHDASASSGFELERTVYRKQWGTPGFPDLSGDYPFYYALRLHDVLFVVLDATTVGPLSRAQKAWLDAVLESGIGARARVVAAHLPIHPITRGRERETLSDANLEALLSRRGVDLFLSGHHHGFFPGFRAGFLQVSQGCLGSGPRRLIGESSPTPKSFTLVEIGLDGKIRVEAYAGPEFETRIDPRSLPPEIRFEGVALWRADLADGSGR